jgi:hypothetical protein
LGRRGGWGLVVLIVFLMLCFEMMLAQILGKLLEGESIGQPELLKIPILNRSNSMDDWKICCL